MRKHAVNTNIDVYRTMYKSKIQDAVIA